jgi:hypothetical protein
LLRLLAARCCLFRKALPFTGKFQPRRLVVVALRPLGKSQALSCPLAVRLRVQL